MMIYRMSCCAFGRERPIAWIIDPVEHCHTPVAILYVNIAGAMQYSDVQAVDTTEERKVVNSTARRKSNWLPRMVPFGPVYARKQCQCPAPGRIVDSLQAEYVSSLFSSLNQHQAQQKL